MCNLLNTVLKVKSRMVAWVQNGCKCVIVYPRDRMVDWELQLAATAQHHEGVSCHLSLALEKINVQNLEYGFYCMSIAFAPS